MESEPPIPNELDTIELHGRSLRAWHQYLVTDHETGEFTGHLSVPCSRYGTLSEDCAWFAVAGECAYVAVAGENLEDEASAGFDYFMSLSVNDSDDLAEIVFDYWRELPKDLHKIIGKREDVFDLLADRYFEQMPGADKLTLEQHHTLGRLCLRHDVTYDPTDYRPAFELPTGWVQGWLGGAAIQEDAVHWRESRGGGVVMSVPVVATCARCGKEFERVSDHPNLRLAIIEIRVA